MAWAGIDAAHIAETARKLVQAKPGATVVGLEKIR